QQLRHLRGPAGASGAQEPRRGPPPGGGHSWSVSADSFRRGIGRPATENRRRTSPASGRWTQARGLSGDPGGRDQGAGRTDLGRGGRRAAARLRPPPRLAAAECPVPSAAAMRPHASGALPARVVACPLRFAGRTTSEMNDDRRYPRYVLGVLVIVYVFNFIDRQILSILAE